MPCHLLFIFTLSQGPTARDLRAAARTGYGTKYLEAVRTLEKDTDTLPVRFDAPTWPRYLSGARASEIAASGSSRVKGLKRTAMAFARRVNSRVVSSRWPVIIITGSRHPNAARVSQSWTPFISGRCTSTIKQASFFGSSLSRTADQLWQLSTVRIRRTKVLFVATRATANMRPRCPGSHCSVNRRRARACNVGPALCSRWAFVASAV